LLFFLPSLGSFFESKTGTESVPIIEQKLVFTMEVSDCWSGWYNLCSLN
jgi:hypothetical protein